MKPGITIATIAAVIAGLAATPAGATSRSSTHTATLALLSKREVRQERHLTRYTGTIRFFHRHPWLLKYGPDYQRWTAMKELRRARVWHAVIVRELAETKAAQLAHKRAVAAELARKRAAAQARSHWWLWSCITNGKGPGTPHEGNGYNGSYTGPLGMSTPWAGHYPTGSDWVHTPVTYVYAIAEQEYAKNHYSKTWLHHQWPETGRSCLP